MVVDANGVIDLEFLHKKTESCAFSSAAQRVQAEG